MTGERLSPQPGSRAPAPGELALVQAFINSHYDLELHHGADLFATPESLGGWLARYGLETGGRLSSRDVARAVALREGMRALASANGSANGAAAPAADPAVLAGLDGASAGASLELRFAPDGRPRWQPAGRGALDRALGTVLAVTATAFADGTWARLKVCPGPHCGWAFYDHSRNGSGRWCSMDVCGGRVKARAHYRRRRGG
jgi:predicted RNA-binding Zn ribbon-like protein